MTADIHRSPYLIYRTFALLLLQFFAMALHAQQVKGKVTDANGRALAFSSVYVKGSTKGTVANNDGYYFLDLARGKYTIVCAHVGYQKREAKIELDEAGISLDFTLNEQLTELKNVEVKANAEDPAYAIIRNAIKTRKEHLDEIKQWQVMVYMKGLIRTYAMPKRIFGVKIDPNRDVIDSMGLGILYFSESLTKYSRRMPDDYKEEVVSAKLSGNSQGFGFNSPHDVDVSFYENSTTLSGLNSRGFISPISENALYFYRYKYEGTFYEDGEEINKIRVMPKRKFEPCYAGGFINIIEGSWRIHSVDLFLTKESQMELLDSLRIVQQMFPVERKYWVPQQTQIEGRFSVLGFVAGASFSAVFSDYDIHKNLDKVFKGNIVKTIDTSANKRSIEYWDSIRPAPLTDEERRDYLKKDTLEKRMQDPRYLDSIDRRSNKPGVMKILLTGQTISNRKKKMSWNFRPLLETVQYNTVEGWLVDFSPTIRHWGDTGAFVINPSIRYGFGNKHFNAMTSISKVFGKTYDKRWRITGSGGKYVYQINPGIPVLPLVNTVSTLLYTKNYMKIYENAFGKLQASHRYKNGLRVEFAASYEDRFPLENTDTSYSWRKDDKNNFTSNYPEELPPGNFDRHQAFITSVTLRYQPGQKFMQYPNRLISLGSDMPVFTAGFTKAWPGLFGSDAAFGKWQAGMYDDFNMKLGGYVNYKLNVGGFINNSEVQLPDWQHFNGNLSIIAGQYLNSFQLAPYYANSTKDHFFASGNLEWHLNGLFTNKIPLIRKWNWRIVTGSNAFYVDEQRNYFEFFVGIENILKSIRVDLVWGYDGFNNKPKTGFVIGFSGLFTGSGLD
jgi:hypothetical protein